MFFGVYIFQIFTRVETNDERKILAIRKSRKWQNKLIDFLKYPFAALLFNMTIFVYLKFKYSCGNFELVLREKIPSFF